MMNNMVFGGRISCPGYVVNLVGGCASLIVASVRSAVFNMGIQGRIFVAIV